MFKTDKLKKVIEVNENQFNQGKNKVYIKSKELTELMNKAIHKK